MLRFLRSLLMNAIAWQFATQAPVSPIPLFFQQLINFVPARSYPPHDSMRAASGIGQV